MDRFHPIRIEVLATSQHEAQAIALEMLNESEIGARPAVEARTISAHDVENLRRDIDQEAHATQSPQVRHTLHWVLNKLQELT